MSGCRVGPVRRAWGIVMVLLATACAPTYDWREVRPAGLGVAAMFPCKPTRESRPVALAGTPVTMTLLACPAGDATFGLAVVELADPGRRAAVRDALRDALAGNLDAPARADGAASTPGADADPPPRRDRVDGRFPDGTPVQQFGTSFARGLRVYQATVQGPRVEPAQVDTFFEGLRAVP